MTHTCFKCGGECDCNVIIYEEIDCVGCGCDDDDDDNDLCDMCEKRDVCSVHGCYFDDDSLLTRMPF